VPTTPDPEVPDEKPEVPATEYPTGITAEVAAVLFGGVGEKYKFNNKGPVSKQWLAYCKRTGQWPALVSVIEPTATNPAKYFQFANGLVIWQPTPNQALVAWEPDSTSGGSAIAATLNVG
jgi:hypothetical protein